MEELKQKIKGLIDLEESAENLLRIQLVLEGTDTLENNTSQFDELLLKALKKSDRQTENLIAHTSVESFVMRK